MACGDSRHPARTTSFRVCSSPPPFPPKKRDTSSPQPLLGPTVQLLTRTATVTTRKRSKSNLQNYSRLRCSHGGSAQDGCFGRSALPLASPDDCKALATTITTTLKFFVPAVAAAADTTTTAADTSVATIILAMARTKRSWRWCYCPNIWDRRFHPFRSSGFCKDAPYLNGTFSFSIRTMCGPHCGAWKPHA